MRAFAAFFLLLWTGAALATDVPFPDTPANHWVYTSMKQIRKDHLWYRANDNIPKRPVPTRMDVAKKAFLLAVDCPNLVESMKRTTALARGKPDNAQTKKWVQQYQKAFPKKKILYQTHVKQVTRLWKYFRPEIMSVAKTFKVDPSTVGKRLANAQVEIDRLHLNNSVVIVKRSKV